MKKQEEKRKRKREGCRKKKGEAKKSEVKRGRRKPLKVTTAHIKRKPLKEKSKTL